MTYFVVGSDGNQYGPADEATLKQWVAEGRVHAGTPLKSAETGSELSAGSIPALFPNAPAAAPAPPAQIGMPGPSNPSVPSNPAAQNYAAYPRQQPYTLPTNQVEDNRMLWMVVFRSVLALLFFFVFRGIGLIVGGYALYYAFQCQASGHSKGALALTIAGVTFAIILIGWFFRLSGGVSPTG